MRRFVPAWRLSMFAVAAMAVAIVSGCAASPGGQQGRSGQVQQQQNALVNQRDQLQERLNNSDLANQRLEASLAQFQQRNQALEQRLSGVNEQLRDITAQLTGLKEAKTSADNQVQALTASMRRRGGVLITPNSSLLKTLPAYNIRGVHVRRDGDVIRVELPGTELFESGSARLLSGANSLIGTVAGELAAIYPDQIIGVEGHTDSDPITGRVWRSNHELSVGRAMIVYDALVSNGRFRSSQLFVVGHGANHPVASNATPGGKTRNRRIELVVYPERSGGR